ncbi:ead/Ea22-like family protein [Salmonella enterica]|uniref:Ead/Ea22-like family protein n=1 Tax=Escherichia coli TaxID=562 RepID=A0A234GQE6_ECOLX|nr:MULTISPECIES: ead/Ea22-like family protein [Escherichia]EBB3281515.1 ead/Ea22-like family protein [Salmonella enterica]EBU7859977.1 ead/Ea22-like family protein [Salmonella enterica subsp. enterica serovar Thompson]ECE6862722.1 ead/Ea22-like family protein [Salmonella enterica subsp. enterica]EDC8741526.1 ead/Ea22-like family protein [Salmonella enterica subsp. enterica serovar Typhimurium]EED9892102.1 ead/Ea22-like family protein [Salmonella enterica subsp. enterica serovar Braenderup]EEE
MSEINYQALRELAKQATQGEWVAFISPGKYGTYAVHTPGDNHHGDIVDWPGFDGQKNAENNARYIAAFNPEVVQALLDEREAQSKRIAELEANFTVLAVENASMKLFIRGCCYVFDGEQDEISDAYICATDGGMPQTPATDAFLAEVRAQGVEMFAECAYTLEHHDHAVAFAAELRKGGSQ